MILIDAENIDYVILEDSLHRIEHKKGDEIDCVIGAEIVKAIPLDRIKQAREEIQGNYEGGNHADEFSDVYYVTINDCIKILDKLIESEG